MVSRKSFTLIEHRAMGAELTRIADELRRLHRTVANTYGLSNRTGRLAYGIVRDVQNLRSKLEDEMRIDQRTWPAEDREIMQSEAWTRVYYPGHASDATDGAH